MDTIENSKTKKFTIQDITDLEDEMYKPRWALLAFGSLLEAADLSQVFGEDWKNASEYRAGLNSIIEMSVSKQDQLIEDLYLKYEQSPESIIIDATRTCNFIKQGAYRTHEDAFTKINGAVEKLNSVVLTFGEEYPQAAAIKTELIELKETLIRSAPVQDLQKAG